MQYKIPLQIENEDTIVLGLSLRQLGIMMGFGGLAYALYSNLQASIGGAALVVAIPIAVIGIIIALTRVSEMTFLPLILNYFRMTLNGQARPWSQKTDGFTPMEIGAVSESHDVAVQKHEEKASFDSRTHENDDFAEKLKNL